MNNEEIISAWKDPDYRDKSGKSIDEMPGHPAGWASLTDEHLSGVVGGQAELELAARTADVMTYGCCTDLKSCEGQTYKLLTVGCCTNNVTFILC